MPVEAFIDTNIFVYSVSSHPAEQDKRDKARALLGSVDFGTSAQVLSEFYVTATQKIAEPLSHSHALHFIIRLTRLPIVSLDADAVLEAIALKQEHRLSYWDGAIIAAAYRLGAKTIYSEDLAHEREYGSVRVINPFRARVKP
ncbi:MAG: VapC toxin family PIN domain ribonuclease [Chthoniobacterales bacterium]|nr:MAG: VapC toxin family PIN domain ribonuclease [Chthoniobacterales bacterium]